MSGLGAGVAAGYDAVAETYAERLADELTRKPLERALLQAYAEQVRAAHPDGVVADVGCGPGHVTAFLAEHGLQPLGVDLSPQMVAVARRRQPELRFEVGSVLDLDAADAAWAGAVALYSLIHLDDAELRQALRELHRVVRPAGLLLLAVHTQHLEHPDAEVLHVDDLWGHAVDLDFRFRRLDVLAGRAETAGFTVAARLEREPYGGVEAPTRRAYVLLRRPG